MLPCEIFVTKVLPSIRRQITLKLLKEGMSQRDVAKLIGTTDAAISQYVKRKRGSNERFSEKLAKIALQFYDAKNSFSKNICEMCKALRSSRSLCALHTKLEKISSKDCALCLSVCK